MPDFDLVARRVVSDAILLNVAKFAARSWFSSMRTCELSDIDATARLLSAISGRSKPAVILVEFSAV